jgi:predicted transposase YbfD/YdcC
VVSAWIEEQHLTLVQVKTEEKGNEITAIPKLLALLDIKGATVAIDAMDIRRP